MSDNESMDNRGISVEAEDLRARLKAAEDKVRELENEVYILKDENHQLQGEREDLEDRVKRYGAIWGQLPEGDHFIHALKSSRNRALRQGNAIDEEDHAPRYNAALGDFTEKAGKIQRYKDNKKQSSRPKAVGPRTANAERTEPKTNMYEWQTGRGKKRTAADESESEFERVKSRKVSHNGSNIQEKARHRGSRISAGNEPKATTTEKEIKTFVWNEESDRFVTE
ncbi:hypothetical protein ACEPPN_011062 [Leptodophora sp. 'Broadleaf-Isolate-01']